MAEHHRSASARAWRRVAASTLCALSSLAVWVAPLQAQQAGGYDKSPKGIGERMLIERMNANILTIVTGSPPLAYSVFGYDLAAVLNDGHELRILPIISQGAFQNVRDVRYLRGVDLGFAQTNILGYYRRTGEIHNI